MSTALLLGFFFFVVAGTAATLFIPVRTMTEDGSDQDEASERLVTAGHARRSRGVRPDARPQGRSPATSSS
jgi:hypothetical protein